MRDTIKNILFGIIFVVLVFLIGVAVYNTFLSKPDETPNDQRVNVDTSDPEYSAENDPYSDDFVNNPEDEGNATSDFTVSTENIGKNQVYTVSDNGKTFSFGIDTDSSVEGILINPKIENDNNRYLIHCYAQNSPIIVNESNPVNEYTNNFKDTQYIYVNDNVINGYNASYVSDDDFGLLWKGSAFYNNDIVNVRFTDYNTLSIVGIFNLYIEKDSEGKYNISNIESALIDSFELEDEACSILDSINAWGMFTKKEIVAEESNSIYYKSMIKSNGYETLYRSNIDNSMYPLYAVTFKFEEIPETSVTVYMTKNGEYFGYSEFSKAEAMVKLEQQLGIYEQSNIENPEIDDTEVTNPEADNIVEYDKTSDTETSGGIQDTDGLDDSATEDNLDTTDETVENDENIISDSTGINTETDINISDVENDEDDTAGNKNEFGDDIL